MNSRERINNAMQMKDIDRVPVMCQLSIGHYFLYSGLDPYPLDIWFTSHGFAEALIRLREKYSFYLETISCRSFEIVIKSGRKIFIRNKNWLISLGCVIFFQRLWILINP